MNNKQKIRLFWKIAKRINKKFCRGKLIINKIILFKRGDLDKSFPKNKGWYFNIDRSILISKKESLEMQITILAHELAHAYQFQFIKEYYDKKKSKLKSKKIKHSKKWEKVMHDKIGGKIYQKFRREIDKMISFKLK